MKIIQLNLGKNWYYFISQRFRPVGKKRNFKAGDLLYKDSEFYIVVPKKKIKMISWNHAGKKIYEALGGTSKYPNYKVSKSKILFAFQINDEEKVQTCLKCDTIPVKKTYYHDLSVKDLPENYTPSTLPILSNNAEKRAKTLFHKIVSSDPRFSIHGKYLFIKSINYKIYQISLISGIILDTNKKVICIYCSCSKYLPFYDIILSKALTIAYAPKLISTL
ncbi:MAG: hypothetical protein ACFFD2_12120 [Promethearchaeota archaeon]